MGLSPAVLVPTSVEAHCITNKDFVKVTGGFNAEMPNASVNFIRFYYNNTVLLQFLYNFINSYSYYKADTKTSTDHCLLILTIASYFPWEGLI